MPKYKKRDPEFTAIQFTGSNIQEIMDELGPEFTTTHRKDLENATSFTLRGYGWELIIPVQTWIVVDPPAQRWFLKWPEQIAAEYEPVRRAGRPPKEKK